MQISQPIDKTYKEVDIFEQLLPLGDKDILDLGCGKAEITRLIVTMLRDYGNRYQVNYLTLPF